MTSLLNMSVAGMALNLVIDSVKKMELDFDTKEYLVDKLTATFFSIQSDISVAIQDGIAELVNDNE